MITTMILRRKVLRQLVIPAAVLVIGLGATAAVALQLSRTTQARDRERFEAAADQLEDAIEGRIDTYIAILRAGAGLLGAADTPTPDDFHAFAERLELQQRYPGVQGIGFTARIPPARLADTTAAQRRLGTPDFTVWPPEPRSEYHAILYLEPLDRRNRAAIGYDMFTEPTRRAAMERARDSGAAAASGMVTLVQEIDADKQPGFLIYMPVYEGGKVPATVEERREHLRGFVYSPFRARDLFAGILGRNPRPRAGFELFDGPPSPASLLHRTTVQEGPGGLTRTRTLDVAGRQWTATIFSTSALDGTFAGQLVPAVILAGAGVTVLLVGFSYLQTRARQRAEDSEDAAEEASRRFKQLANSIPQLAWIARPDGRIYWYNDRWYEYTGMTPGQVNGRGWENVFDPEEMPKVVERWRHSVRTGEPFEMEFPIRGADGHYRTFLTRVEPFRDSTGTIVQWFGTNTDVQYRRDAERSLREHAETLEILNRSGTQLAGELDLDRLVQAVTDAATQVTKAQFGAFFYNTVNAEGETYTLYTLSGVPREAFAGFPMPRNTAVFGPTFRGDGVIRSDDITADPRYGRNAPYHGMPSGHLPVRSYLAVPVRSRSGEVLGGLFFGHAEKGVFTQQAEDIVAGIAARASIAIDNARLYQQIQQLLESERAARTEAERVSRLKDEFLATLSHELRTPLNAVVGWAHMLSAGTLGEDKRRHAIDTILRNARIQSQLIEDLLDMSRIISGRVSIDMKVVDLREVIDASVSAVRPTADAKGVRLEVIAAPGSYALRGDANRLQQIAWNLLTNAIKFTPAGGQVLVALSQRAGELELTISDTGIGIDVAFLPHVFERFRQADGSFTRGHGGLGLGLSIVRSLVEMHAGTVNAASGGAHQGATFTVSLPAASDGDRTEQQIDRQRTPPADVQSRDLQDVALLVIDDDRDASELTAEVLEQHGARVRTASSAAEALRMLETGTERVDLLICDIGMPQMDGFELIRRVRELPAHLGGTAPAIALTAYAGADDRTRASAAGFDMHLAKPFVPADLVAACTTLVRTDTL